MHDNLIILIHLKKSQFVPPTHLNWLPDGFVAYSAVCTHLGCLTSYFPNEKLFKCPCHGSNFSLQGDPLAGPAPVPLYRLALSVDKDGQITVDKAQREDREPARDQPPFVLLNLKV